jgi:hypothetical protein
VKQEHENRNYPKYHEHNTVRRLRILACSVAAQSASESGARITSVSIAEINNPDAAIPLPFGKNRLTTSPTATKAVKEWWRMA